MEIWREINQATVVYFPLIDRGTLDFENTPPTFVAADCQFSIDKGAFANTGSTPVHEGNGIYSLDLLAAEVNGQNISITVIDSATKLWEDQAIIVSTYGSASAEHAVNLNDTVRAGLTALPNFAADAAGGLPVSDVGGLDLDAKLANTNEITVARMGALTDWIDAGRLDVILDIIAADVVNIDGQAMRGTDGVDTATMRGTDGVDTSAMRGTDNVPVASVTGTSDSGGLNTMVDATRTEIDTHWVGSYIRFGSGGSANNVGVTRMIDTFTAATDTIRFNPDVLTAITTETYEILPVVNIDEILADTNQLQQDWVNGGRLDVILDIIAADTTTDIPATITTMQNDLDIITGADGVNLLSATQTSVDAIEADTNELQLDWQNTGRLDNILDARMAETSINTTGGAVDTVTTLTGHTAQTADHTTAIADIPTVSEFNARTILSASYFDPAADTVVNVTNVATLTGHTNQTGDSFARIGAAGASLTDLGGMSTGMKAEVLVEINAALDAAISELTVTQPSATPSVRTGIMLMYMALRNKLDVQTSGTDALEIHNAAGTQITSKLLTDDGSDYSEAAMS